MMLRCIAFVIGIACLVCSIFSQAVHAEQWQTVQGREKFLTVSVDLDSLQVGQHEDMIFFKLRADDHDDAIATRFVQASCSEFSMEVERETIFHPSSQHSETLDWQQNTALKTHPDFAQARLSFWGYTQAYGQAISLACRRVGNLSPDRLQSLQPEYCALDNPLRKVACASHASWRANYKLYFSRSHDVIHNCGISEERMTKQAAWLIKSAMRCQNELCGNEILEQWIHKRGQDIANVIHMQKNNDALAAQGQREALCPSLNQADQAIASMQTEEIYAKAKYVGCLKRETARLRAANTPAARLASQAEQACDPQFKEWHETIAKKSARLDN